MGYCGAHIALSHCQLIYRSSLAAEETTLGLIVSLRVRCQPWTPAVCLRTRVYLRYLLRRRAGRRSFIAKSPSAVLLSSEYWLNESKHDRIRTLNIYMLNRISFIVLNLPSEADVSGEPTCAGFGQYIIQLYSPRWFFGFRSDQKMCQQNTRCISCHAQYSPSL